LAESRQGAAESSDRAPAAGTVLVRILAGAVLIPLVLAVNYWGGVVFAVFTSLVAGLAGHEFYRLCARGAASPSRLVGILGSIGVCFSFYTGSLDLAGLVLTGFIMLILVERLARQDTADYARSAGMTVLGLVYSGWLMGFFILLRNATYLPASGFSGARGPGHSYILFVLILTWSYDTLAYFGGSLLGRHHLFNRISPSKTVEGTAIGLAGSVAAALLCRWAFAEYLGWAEAVLVGLLIGVVAQVGDLVESIVKRSTNTKDSSRLIPGHGGILDRFDSLLFTGPVFYFYLRAVTSWAGQ
jgi:phosphatidate cytidylyltransferase